MHKTKCFLKMTLQSPQTALISLFDSTPNLTTVFLHFMLQEYNKTPDAIPNTVMRGLIAYPRNVLKYSF